MSCLFKARSTEGHIFKILTELLQNNLKQCCYTLSADGIMLRMMDSQQRVVFDINLEGNKFDAYKFKYKESKTVGLYLSHFYKYLLFLKMKNLKF